MISLKDYICRHCNNNIPNFDEYASGTLTPELETTTNSILIDETDVHIKTRKFIIPVELLKYQEFISVDHEKFMDDLILHLSTQKNPKNLLIEGYTDITNLHNATSATSLVCPGVNTTVQLLKSPIFKVVHLILGSASFYNLLVNCSAYTCNLKFKLWGPIEVHEYKTSRRDNLIYVTKMLFKDIYWAKHCVVIPQNSVVSLSEIFDVNYRSEIKVWSYVRFHLWYR
ncbi:unnamed protein product [Ambrosiozyma monospora]|uniref:Unnamed protein product n=1 Tax=Ambrosiozyma monospora TaxID=43982 RepID=A0A9W7DN88_AMBMO|nr:unnamed protein product [Ambrosiozyma monospora]